MTIRGVQRTVPFTELLTRISRECIFVVLSTENWDGKRSCNPGILQYGSTDRQNNMTQTNRFVKVPPPVIIMNMFSYSTMDWEERTKSAQCNRNTLIFDIFIHNTSNAKSSVLCVSTITQHNLFKLFKPPRQGAG